MYICEVCGTQTAPRVPCQIIPVKVREKTYNPRLHANDPGGSGHEIVCEVRACPPCANSRSLHK